MKFNLIDLLALAYVIRGAVRGRRRGMGTELASVIAVLAAIFTGTGLTCWLARAMAWFNHFLKGFSIVLGCLGIYVSAYLLLCAFRQVFVRWVESCCPSWRTFGGEVLGAFRCLVVASFIIVWLGLVQVGWIHRTFGERCLIGRTLAATALPVYEYCAGK
jgi:ABC-type dipeptide/oligopeptide/nickel transport system permease component